MKTAEQNKGVVWVGRVSCRWDRFGIIAGVFDSEMDAAEGSIELAAYLDDCPGMAGLARADHKPLPPVSSMHWG